MIIIIILFHELDTRILVTNIIQISLAVTEKLSNSYFFIFRHINSNSKNKIITAKSRQIVLSLHDDEFKYFEGYVRNGE